jgi:pimeloyl-ACP methyl ester carboxylesterase
MAKTPRDEWLVTDGLRLHYRDWGGSGRPVVLLHGLASTCHIWDLVAPLLGDDFAVVALDQRGHGESDRPDRGYDFATVGDDLHGLIGALGLERPVIVGHSWGGDVAMEYAVAHPDVPGGLALVDGGMIEVSNRPGMTLAKAKEELAPPKFVGTTAEDLIERARSWDNGLSMNPQLEGILLANFDVLEDKTIRARLSRENHMRIIEALWEHRPSLLCPQVQSPVLLMPARRQANDPPAARRFRREEAVATAAELLPRSKTVWLEDSIHDVPLQRPQLVADVISDNIRNGLFGQWPGDDRTVG